MFEYQLCDQVDDHLTFQAFSEGFTDYIIKFDFSEEYFIEHFFGAEGNLRNLSWIATKENQPAGVVLGGIRDVDGQKTMRCGALCVSPKFRGSAAARTLMEKLEDTAKLNHCQRILLEVIIGNDRAVNFYKKLGYQEINQISYYTLKGEQVHHLNCKKLRPGIEIREISLEQVRQARSLWQNIPVNWQSDVAYFAEFNSSHFGVFDQEEIVGFTSFYRGQIFLIWVNPEYRKQGIGCLLIEQIHQVSAAEQYRITVMVNPVLESFCRHLGMAEMEIHQYEMEKRF